MVDVSAQASGRLQQRGSFPLWIGFYSLVAIATIALLNLPAATDYVGIDNDDVMRLVEVRDLLAGQSWFDLMQYRLGLADGTLMHWSRLIDLPIALLIRLFSHVVPSEQAEALALLVWPFSLVFALMGAMAGAIRVPFIRKLPVPLTQWLIGAQASQDIGIDQRVPWVTRL
eukprot:gene48138-64596_t